MVEFGGQTLSEAESQALRLIDALSRSATPPQRAASIPARKPSASGRFAKSSLGATSHVPGEPLNWEGWEDAAVAPEKLGGYLRDLRKMMADFNYKGSLYGHFGHACVHTRLNFDLQSKEGIAKFRKFVEEAADLVVSYGGSLSGEHGDGQARAELLPKMFGPELMEAFRKFKTAWDPDWKMNPGKLIGPPKRPNKLDANLRLGAELRSVGARDPLPVSRRSRQPLARRPALRRSRQMPPRRRRRHVSQLARHSRRRTLHPRPRSLALGDDARVKSFATAGAAKKSKHSLDLCLACKGCKSDCPVGVDVATYKAEFLSHYYEGRLRPLSAYAFGNIDFWARLASIAPGVVNLTTQLPFLRDIAKQVAGIPRQRSIPPFAPETFKQWFRRTSRVGADAFVRPAKRSERGAASSATTLRNNRGRAALQGRVSETKTMGL